MADNYLERRMEEYRRSRQGSAVNHVHNRPSGLKPGQVAVNYPARRVLVSGGTSPEGEAVINMFRRFGCRVAFTIVDEPRKGNQLAQQSGAQYHPGSLADASSRLADAADPVSVTIDLDTGTPSITLNDSEVPVSIAIPAAAIIAGPAAVASWCLFAAHPSNGWLKNL